MKSWIQPIHSLLAPIRCALVLATAAGISAAAFGASSAAYPPQPRPDRVVLTWSGDPASTQAVTWRTDASVTAACAEIVPAGDGAIAGEATRRAARSEVLRAPDAPAAQCHSVEFTGLAPDSAYAYRVGDGKNWSEWFQFRTARREAAPFTFLFFGDPQFELRSQWSRVWRQGWLAAPQAAFAVLTGDLIDRGERDAEWGQWFEAVGWIGSTRPLVLATGSHEYVTTTAATGTTPALKALSPHWRAQFTLPATAPAGLEESCYAFDYQGVRFVVLNAQEKREEQAAWLRQTLGAARPRWTILAFHEPIFSGGRNRDNKRLRELWKPAIDELRVDLVLTGHDHVYARSGLDRVPTGYPAEREVVNGTVYVVAVSGPKMYELSVGTWAERAVANTPSYQTITIDGDELRYRADTATGRPFDAFTLRQRAGQRNELIETLPPARSLP